MQAFYILGSNKLGKQNTIWNASRIKKASDNQNYTFRDLIALLSDSAFARDCRRLKIP
jgi:hypothetical protein